MIRFSDAELERRCIETLLASWEAYAASASGASLLRFAGVSCCVVPFGPERAVYNNALLRHRLTADERAQAIRDLASAYAGAGVETFAAWVQEADQLLRSDLEQAGFHCDSSTRAMAMNLAIPIAERPAHSVGELCWDEYRARFSFPEGVLAKVDRSQFRLIAARNVSGRAASAALLFVHKGDCGIYNVETREDERGQGYATSVMIHALTLARDLGCQTASLQSTQVAERLYARLGFRDLGRFLEYVPGSVNWRESSR